MKALIQRVKEASVIVSNKKISEIKKGLLVFLGVKNTDTELEMKHVVEKISKLRIFEDEDGKMNLSIKDTEGEVLVVSQFTLYGDTKKGNRPSFIEAARPEEANKIYEDFCSYLSSLGIKVKKGQFQAMMDVSLINDGPVTVMIEK